MRVILFKAKRKDNGEWVEGDVMHEPYGACIQYCDNKKRTKVVVIPDTICQYTGLTDKNGNKIWENDIVEVIGEEGYFTCEWDDDTARYVLSGDGLTVDFDNCWSHEIEVVGNILDNPELLEVE